MKKISVTALLVGALVLPYGVQADPLSSTPLLGHVTSGGGIYGPPTVGGGSCGTPVLTYGSTDFAGQFETNGTTTCAVTFGKAFSAQPFCIVQDQTTLADSGFTFSTSGNQYTGFVMGTTASSDFITWICIGQSIN